MCVGAKNSKVKAVNIPSKVKIKNVTYKDYKHKGKGIRKNEKIKEGNQLVIMFPLLESQLFITAKILQRYILVKR